MRITQKRLRVLNAIESLSFETGEFTFIDLRERAFGVSNSTIKGVLLELIQIGAIRRIGYGVYKRIEP